MELLSSRAGSRSVAVPGIRSRPIARWTLDFECPGPRVDHQRESGCARTRTRAGRRLSVGSPDRRASKRASLPGAATQAGSGSARSSALQPTGLSGPFCLVVAEVQRRPDSIASTRHEAAHRMPPRLRSSGRRRWHDDEEMEPETGFEPVTPALRKRCSTVELLWLARARGARAERASSLRPSLPSRRLRLARRRRAARWRSAPCPRGRPRPLPKRPRRARQPDARQPPRPTPPRPAA